MSSSDNNNTTEQKFDYFLVLDFEASCDDKIKNFRNEIIEFPTVAINAKTVKIDHEFHYYVKPKANPILTDFCKELTGIQQDWIDNGVEFEDVLKFHNQWMMDNFISKNLTFAFVTCGDWDLKTMITKQCRKENIKVPSYFSSWVNIKKKYTEIYSKHVHGMTDMLNHMKLELIGKHHSGIDDCKNIARILCEMLKQGKQIDITAHIDDFKDMYVDKKKKK
ncbi:exonuclease III protein [Naegleria gruberi]|uniref:Exonuclease III protein n=1 Tax=Naegleria gruberi TaxID=5762 RepID=D2V9V9_NAEGR|nr:exonuclease III protein [Naegleria gruberi]EFC46315.1 exonuclease III protein [Naegleria gruberi]|eukprot:XP_002679059.1 exonuclease III protein [Naegleria gruberi strain NEG-M]